MTKEIQSIFMRGYGSVAPLAPIRSDTTSRCVEEQEKKRKKQQQTKRLRSNKLVLVPWEELGCGCVRCNGWCAVLTNSVLQWEGEWVLCVFYQMRERKWTEDLLTRRSSLLSTVSSNQSFYFWRMVSIFICCQTVQSDDGGGGWGGTSPVSPLKYPPLFWFFFVLCLLFGLPDTVDLLNLTAERIKKLPLARKNSYGGAAHTKTH